MNKSLSMVSAIFVIGVLCFSVSNYSASTHTKKESPTKSAWPEGSYCIFQGGNSCPSGFSKEHRYLRGIKMRDSVNPNYITKERFGQSQMKTHRPLNVPEVSKPYPSPDTLGDIEFFLCCK